MPNRILFTLLLFVTAAASNATAQTPATDDSRAALQAACFPAPALGALKGENQVHRRTTTFDKPPADLPDAAAAEPVVNDLRGAIRRVDLPPGDKSIALTFDLCEQRGEIAGYDGDIIDILRREAVKATLFAGGKWLRSHETRAEQLISDPLFEIANHSETHRNLRLLTPIEMTREITGPARNFAAARARLAANQCATTRGNAANDLQTRLSLFRFPFGACNAASLNAVNDAGYLAIQWSLSPGDPDPHQSAAAITSAVVRRIKPGDIVVLHANGRGWNTAKALPELITRLKAKGFTFATVSELIARGKPVITQSCYNVRPGDTDRYDFGIHSLAQKKRPEKSPATKMP